MVRYVLFRLLRVLGWLMILPLIVALIYKEYDSALSFLALAVIMNIAGILGSIRKPENRVIYAKEGFAITAAAWLVMSCMGAIPFVITGTIPTDTEAKELGDTLDAMTDYESR